MRKLLAVLLLTSCSPARQSEPPPSFNPVVYVVYDCGDPFHDHDRPEDATLDRVWPPMICIGGVSECNGK
jgi:hypothetical protein